MKKTRFTEAQIFSILKEYDAGKNIQDVCREHGVSKATVYNWKSKYGGMQMSELKRVKELEEENRKLKQMYADLAWTIKCSKTFWEKSSEACREAKPRGLFERSFSSQPRSGL
jgi:putative transposase